MTPEFLEPSLLALDSLAGYDAVCVLITEDERPLEGTAGFVDWRLGGALSRVLKSGFFVGSPDEKLLVPTDARLPAPRLFVMGLGPSSGVTPLGLEHALGAAAAMLTKAGVHSVALSVSRVPQIDDAATASLMTRAFLPGMSGQKVALFADKALRSRMSSK